MRSNGTWAHNRGLISLAGTPSADSERATELLPLRPVIAALNSPDFVRVSSSTNAVRAGATSWTVG
jgi:hypothetical protein